jgi:hypothetical protein
MEPQSPSAPSDISWTPIQAQSDGGQVPPTSAPQKQTQTVPTDISWAPAHGAPKKEPEQWDVVKAISRLDLPTMMLGDSPEEMTHRLKGVARGALGAMAAGTGEKPDEIAYRNKLLGLDDKDPDKGAEFVGGFLAPMPGGGEGATMGAARLADKAKKTLGQITGSETLQYIEKSLARLPGGDMIRHAIKAQNQQLGNQTAALVDRLAAGADTSSTGAGKVIQSQMEEAAQRMKATAADQYGEVEKLIPPDTKIGVKSTLKTLQELTNPTPGAESLSANLIDPTMKKMREGLEKDIAASNMDALPYSALKALRSKLGNMIEWGPFSTDPKNGQLKRVYEALTADMNTGAASHSDAAAEAVRKANANYAISKKQQEVLTSVINKAGGPEKVFSALISGTKEGATTITQVVNAMDGPSRQILAASALERMGKATPGTQSASGDVFSAATFLIKWSQMSPEARHVLFDQLPGDYAQHISQLAANVGSLKAYEGILANPAGTAHAALWGGAVGETLMALMTGNVHAAAAIGGGVAGNVAVSAALTNPRTAAWLARKTSKLVMLAAKGEYGVSTNEEVSHQIDPLGDPLGVGMDPLGGAPPQ